MTNIEFKQALNQILKPHGFKKKSNTWTLVFPEITKIISLQKSNFSNLYYLDWGFNINQLDYKEVLMHIDGQIGSGYDENENELIKKVLDLEYNMDEEERVKELTRFIEKYVINFFKEMNNINDLKKYLLLRKDTCIDFLKVKEFLQIE
jgi:hypothetical protein